MTKETLLTITADGANATTHDHPGGWLSMTRHDAATVSAGTTTLGFKMGSNTNYQDVKDNASTAELTESGTIRVFLPPCTIQVTTASYAGSGNILLLLRTDPADNPRLG